MLACKNKITSFWATGRLPMRKSSVAARANSNSHRSSSDPGYGYDNTRIFKDPMCHTTIDWEDLDTAWDMARHIRNWQHRHDIYMSYGIRGDHMDKYYVVVRRLENTYLKSPKDISWIREE